MPYCSLEFGHIGLQLFGEQGPMCMSHMSWHAANINGVNLKLR